MTRLAALVLLALAACGPTPQHVAVDACLLKEYLNDCPGEETATPAEIAACEKQAPLSATRVVGGIPEACRQIR